MEVNFDFWQGVTEISHIDLSGSLFEFEEGASGYAPGYCHQFKMESVDYRYSGNANANGFG